MLADVTLIDLSIIHYPISSTIIKTLAWFHDHWPLSEGGIVFEVQSIFFRLGEIQDQAEFKVQCWKYNTVLWGILDLVHSRFRGSVNCGAPSMENSFQVAKFIYEDQNASSLFCPVHYGPAVIWVACIGLRESSKWSLRSAKAFSEAFWTFCQNWDTQSQQAALMQFQKISWNMNIYTKIYHKGHHGPHGPLIFMIFIIWMFHFKRLNYT